MKSIFAFFFSTFALYAADITVTVTNCKSNNGKLLSSLHDNAKTFPIKPDKAFKRRVVAARKGTLTLAFNDIPPGKYAIATIHDENGNGRLDANLIGIPKEGVGASRGAKGRFGPPEFKDAAFEIKSTIEKKEISIQLQY